MKMGIPDNTIDPNMNHCPDDTVCAYCGSDLKSDEGWNFDGFCDAECALLLHIGNAEWPDDDAHGGTRKEVMQAINELTAKSA